MQNDLTDSVKWAIDQGIADPDNICIYGGSYGVSIIIFVFMFLYQFYKYIT